MIKLHYVTMDQALTDQVIDPIRVVGARNSAEAITEAALHFNLNQSLLKAVEVMKFASRAEARRFIIMRNGNVLSLNKET